MIEGLVGLLILVLDIWAIINVINSAATTGAKVIWCLVILFLPVVGLLIWFFLGPRGR